MGEGFCQNLLFLSCLTRLDSLSTSQASHKLSVVREHRGRGAGVHCYWFSLWQPNMRPLILSIAQSKWTLLPGLRFWLTFWLSGHKSREKLPVDGGVTVHSGLMVPMVLTRTFSDSEICQHHCWIVKHPWESYLSLPIMRCCRDAEEVFFWPSSI